MKNILCAIAMAILVVAGPWLLWQWGFCRFYVGPDQMAVITAKTGAALPPGQILAKKGQQGIQEDVLGEGRHFLNPWLYEREIRSVVMIPPGKVGIVTSKVGPELPEGVEYATRVKDGKEIRFLINYTERSQTVNLNLSLKNALTGAPEPPEMTIPAFDVKVLIEP